MEIKTAIDEYLLTDEIRFYGDSYEDRKVVKRINELSDILSNTCWILSNFKNSLNDRNEHSAKEIQKAIENLEKQVIRRITVWEE